MKKTIFALIIVAGLIVSHTIAYQTGFDSGQITTLLYYIKGLEEGQHEIDAIDRKINEQRLKVYP